MVHGVYLRCYVSSLFNPVCVVSLLIIIFRELVGASLISPPNVLTVSTFIVKEFEQGSVQVGMAMAIICVLFSTTSLIALNMAVNRRKGK